MSTSVVMATRNGARYIGEQLASLATQTVLPGELVVSDDASSDDTLSVVESFAKRARFPVRIHQNQEALGYGENFLRASALALGRDIAFCDQDDVWLPTKLETAERVMRATGAGLFAHTATTIDARGRELGHFSQRITRDAVHRPLTLPPWGVFYGFSVVVEASLLRAVPAGSRGPHTYEHSGLLTHDLWAYFLGHSLSRTFTHHAPLVLYRRHGENETPDVLRRTVRSFTSSLGRAVHPRLPRRDIARLRAGQLRNLARQRDLEVALTASRYWDRVADHERRRMETYAQPRLPQRTLALARCVRSGVYRNPDQGGLGHRLVLKDAVAGVARMRRG